MCYQRGVSLIELIIGIVVLSLVLALGMPSFSAWVQNAQTRTAAESILNGLQLARNEAVRRNANVRFSLTNGAGRVAWTVGCVEVRNDCPAQIQERLADEGGMNARVGVSTAVPANPVPATQYVTALAIGAGLSSGESEEGEESEEGGEEEAAGAGVTFNGVGGIPSNNIGTDITRIDVMNAASEEARRLVIIIGAGGSARMCDPKLSLADNAQGCS